MPPYTNQHYLPCCYLAGFASKQLKKIRKSQIWRFDGRKLNFVTCESQCAEKYIYSKTNPEKVEKEFHFREDAYSEFVRNVKAGIRPTPAEYGTLLLNLFDFFLRNAIHKNKTGKEGILAYGDRVNMFFALIASEEKFTIDSVKKFLTTNWGVEIVRVPQGSTFYTSDNPSVLLKIDKRSDFQLIILPMDSQHMVVAFDMRFTEFVSYYASINDVCIVNETQVRNCERCIFSSSQPGDSEKADIEYHFKQKVDYDCEVSEQGWRFRTVVLKDESQLSFIRSKA